MTLTTEARVREILSRDRLRRLASWAAPIAGYGGSRANGRGGIGGGGWRASPLADAMEVEDGEAGRAGPDRSGAADHIVADHTFDSAASEFVLDFLDELGYGRGIGRRIRH
ncbi:hypothetical protein HPP92_019953 [Vanilla planifolia]|uniref:Uncharacterized protein n=1 Tax=Vanilla planifolia TaxID=51239 RepID=A0A835UJT7_VANPL|nr:hypothetical protein HPP92_019953 [Vanilla planifolia]